jgi:hypothetical protein
MIGQINDLAGTENSSETSAAPKLSIDQSTGAVSSSGSAIPVIITGTRPPLSTHFPGLRETMIGSAIFQLAEQIPVDNEFRAQIQELALKLHQSGAEKIIRSRKTAGARKAKKA